MVLLRSIFSEGESNCIYCHNSKSLSIVIIKGNWDWQTAFNSDEKADEKSNIYLTLYMF